MTPLAAYLAKQLVCRPKHREGVWCDAKMLPELRYALDDTHFFDVSACFDLIVQTMRRPRFDELFSTFGFLPAPKTWLEWTIGRTPHGGNRRAALLIEKPELMADDDGVMRKAVGVSLFEHQNATAIGFLIPETGDFCLEEKQVQDTLAFADPIKSASVLMGIIETMLVLINSPKIIGRRQHMPNRGLERELTRGIGAGKFPLHAWTEILLQVNKPPEIDDGEPHEAHLTGRRALHFCRKHIRIRHGQLEYVCAHWRGDPALGLKQSRYTVTA